MRGSFTVEGLDIHRNNSLIIDFQNENLIARLNGAIVACVPDLICCLEIEGMRSRFHCCCMLNLLFMHYLLQVCIHGQSYKGQPVCCVLLSRCFHLHADCADKAVALGENNDLAFHSWSGNEHGHLGILFAMATASGSDKGAPWANALLWCICSAFGVHYMTCDLQVELRYQQRVSGTGCVSLSWFCQLIQC